MLITHKPLSRITAALIIFWGFVAPVAARHFILDRDERSFILHAKAFDRTRELLWDSGSADFKEVTVRKGVVCGYVNARTQAQHFMGWTRFMYFSHPDVAAVDMSDAAFIRAWGLHCQRR